MIPEIKAHNRFESGQALLASVLVVIILIPIGYSIVHGILPKGVDSAELFLERPDPKYEKCVKDTEYMRYHHWELLRGIREEIVRYGIRGEIGLYGCRDCHTSREGFCNKCHDAVSLTPDCFDCHYYP
ncbi:MAG: hypothetical protein ACYTG7_03490 [Planctomycetota bacterium]|jgi:hypothetical protein